MNQPDPFGTAVRSLEVVHEDEPHIVSTLMDRLPAFQSVVSLVHDFMDLKQKNQAAGISSWLERARKSGSGGARWFARSLQREQAALEVAISSPWSSSPVEGIITNIKLIKRQVYRGASFETLQARILTASPPLQQ